MKTLVHTHVIAYLVYFNSFLSDFLLPQVSPVTSIQNSAGKIIYLSYGSDVRGTTLHIASLNSQCAHGSKFNFLVFTFKALHSLVLSLPEWICCCLCILLFHHCLRSKSLLPSLDTLLFLSGYPLCLIMPPRTCINMLPLV